MPPIRSGGEISERDGDFIIFHLVFFFVPFFFLFFLLLIMRIFGVVFKPILYAKSMYYARKGGGVHRTSIFFFRF